MEIPKHGFQAVHRLPAEEKYRGKAEIVMLVWHENQIMPAEYYRTANYNGKSVDIAICEDPNVQKKQLGDKAIIYNFSSAGSGSGGHS